jgi:hypothetical protein|tara:strand:- start:204 stop:800 length:597 start_codon:yes stop_codon:yes gene_type:complete
MGQETRVFDVFGPKLQIETGNPVMGTPGRSAFSLMSTTDSNVKFVQAHTESGLTKFYSEGTMQFEAGAHPKMVSNNATAFAFIAHRGDFAINADKGAVRISGKQIVLEASREIVIQSPKIRIGYDIENKTKDIKIIGQEVDIKTKKGNLANVLMTSSFLKTFDGSLIADIALDKAGGPVSSAVKNLVKGASNIFNLKF